MEFIIIVIISLSMTFSAIIRIILGGVSLGSQFKLEECKDLKMLLGENKNEKEKIQDNKK